MRGTSAATCRPTRSAISVLAGCDGVIVNQPTRAVRGHNWAGEHTDWTTAPEEYGAIHFHDDDLVDACWEPDFSFTVPMACAPAFTPRRLTTDGFDFWVPFFVRPPRGQARSKVAFLASTATYTAYLNNRGRFLSILHRALSGPADGHRRDRLAADRVSGDGSVDLRPPFRRQRGRLFQPPSASAELSPDRAALELQHRPFHRRLARAVSAATMT